MLLLVPLDGSAGCFQRGPGIIRTTGGKEKLRVEMIVPDGDVERMIDMISEVAWTGKIGDGKIFISDITEAVRIRTGERGETGL